MNLTEILNTPLSEVGLKHYASQYYDPVKAHEYYMKNRELKGRPKKVAIDDPSQSNSSQTQSSTSSNTSASTSNGTSSEKSASSVNKNSANSSTYEEEYERYMFNANKKISNLQRRLSRLSKEARLLLQDEIYAEIDKLREENMNKKYELKAKYGKGGKGGGSSASSYSEITSANYKKKYGS